MKTRVRTIHGKVLVQGGINPENELKPHEILLDEKADGTVELKERNINGEVVSIAGGGSSSDGISIPFYYMKDTSDEVQQGEISLNSEIPIVYNSGGGALWDKYSWVSFTSSNRDRYLGAFSYYIDSTQGDNVCPISIELSEEIDANGTKLTEAVTTIIKNNLRTYKKDLNIMYHYIYYSSTNKAEIVISSKMEELLDRKTAIINNKFFTGGFYLYHYDYNKDTLNIIADLYDILGTMLLMPTEEWHYQGGGGPA